MANFNDYIWACYSSRNSTAFTFSPLRTPSSIVSLTDNPPFSKFMKIHLDGDELEFPCAYKYTIGDALVYNNRHLDDRIDTLYIPMFSLMNIAEESRTTNPVLKTFFYSSLEVTNLIKKKAGGVVYYGGAGIITYEDFTPLMLLTLKVSRIKESNRYKYAPQRTLLRVNPIVYQRDDLLAKYIRTKLIANILEVRPSNSMYSWRRYDHIRNVNDLYTTSNIDYNFKVIIDDLSSFFEEVKKPDATFTTDKVNLLLNDNLNSIISEIQ